MTGLPGLRVLVVEDEGAVAFMIEDILQNLGCEIVASVARLGDAQEIAATAAIDIALLDVNLFGRPVFPVAEVLRQRRIPFIFSTGYGMSGLPREYSSHPVLGKPFSATELQQTMALALER